jgi:hypothetical protein
MLGTGMLMSVMREIDKAVQGELDNEQDAVLRRLRQLHRSIELNEIDEARFEELETQLLERLETIKRIRR